MIAGIVFCLVWPGLLKVFVD